MKFLIDKDDFKADKGNAIQSQWAHNKIVSIHHRLGNDHPDQDSFTFSCLQDQLLKPIDKPIVLTRRYHAGKEAQTTAESLPDDPAALALLPLPANGSCPRYLLAHQDGQGLGHRIAVLAFAANLAAEFGFRLGATATSGPARPTSTGPTAPPSAQRSG